MSSQPAHLTKHIPQLQYNFNSTPYSLAQLTDGVSNGTALWLGGQCLAMYLAQHHGKLFKSESRTPRAIELGSGIGLTALALASLGWDVVATDTPHVVTSVLKRNISTNLSTLPSGSGTVQVRELDWLVPHEQWTWDNPSIIASSATLSELTTSSPDLLRPPFDLIFTADTVYATELIEPMLRTLSTLSCPLSSSNVPPVLLCVERRDPRLVDRLLSDAKEKWGFTVERIPHRKVAKALEKSGTHWEKGDWEDVELWKLKLRPGAINTPKISTGNPNLKAN
ncbi:hypothetical protein CPB83DRAFT_847524 [Crepidotus variabilis]|uniref:Uncharacterized protein n=1 Tax=Crepidotus variabilis TaxID=179855 RepID=A0A9P6ENS4_9AGAR|nr:hypothetical protein CPB83DRAFT_847524 [Crepidotus variabilis]